MWVCREGTCDVEDRQLDATVKLPCSQWDLTLLVTSPGFGGGNRLIRLCINDRIGWRGGHIALRMRKAPRRRTGNILHIFREVILGTLIITQGVCVHRYRERMTHTISTSSVSLSRVHTEIPQA